MQAPTTRGMPSPRTWSVRRRVTVASVLAVVTAVTLGLIAFNLVLGRILTDAVADEARTQAEQIATLVAAGDYSAAAAVVERPAKGSVVQLIADEGQVLASSEGHAASTPMTTLRAPVGEVIITRTGDEPDDPGPHVIAVRGLKDTDGEDYTLVVARALDTPGRLVTLATALLGILGLLLVIGLVLLVRRILDSALQPVEQIRQQVAAIDRTGSEERVSVPPTTDEIAGLARTMNAMLDRLSQADAAHRRFISDASHELRSPLATIRTTLETSPSAADEEHVVMHREAVRMQQLVDDLLLLARADDRGLELRHTEIDLDDLVAEEARRLRTLAVAPVQVQIVPARVLGDAARLTQALRNLTDNAVHHTQGTLRVLMEDEAGAVLVHVDDEGDPVPTDLRDVVFDRFVRLDGSRSRDEGGSGLGLAITRAIVTAHGGTVVATETPEGWCRFTLRLPREGAQP